jgi:pullulanase/glycogen debranching enzyme
VGQGDRGFAAPAWQDLVIAEAHVRDLAAQAPVKITPAERLGFAGLRAWVESPDFYLHRLGVNCVELQPLHEFDSVTTGEYHWGYMTNNFFAPESSYARDATKATGVRELQSLVAAFHRRGMAVVLDVVFNHVGVPAHLMAIDRLYYFEQDANGALTNYSGCGNDLRARAAMARRLIIDSCTHYIEAYGVDGFRFDLAELLGVVVLRDIEMALKQRDFDRGAVELSRPHRGLAARHGLGLVERRLPGFPARLCRGPRGRGAAGIFSARLAVVFCEVARADDQLHGVA